MALADTAVIMRIITTLFSSNLDIYYIKFDAYTEEFDPFSSLIQLGVTRFFLGCGLPLLSIHRKYLMNTFSLETSS